MSEPTPLFLTQAELQTLTGRKLKRLQVIQLKAMLIPFHVNALGEPVVAREAITGTGKAETPAKHGWMPKVVNS